MGAFLICRGSVFETLRHLGAPIYSVSCIVQLVASGSITLVGHIRQEGWMPRGIYNRSKAKKGALAIVPDVSADINVLVPPDAFNTLAWWKKLNDEEQAAVQHEGQLLAQALLDYGKSRLAVGEHLSKLQGLLEPHNLFGRFLKNFHFSKRTAYRYISGYNNAKARLPETVLKAAMARGVNIVGDTDVKPLGIYTEAVAKLPPPTQANEVQANTWLDQIEQVRKETRAAAAGGGMFTVPVPQDPQTLLKECYRFVSLRYKRLPNSSKIRANWVRSLVGMILADLGVSGEQTFVPHKAPEDFVAQRGRPQIASA